MLIQLNAVRTPTASFLISILRLFYHIRVDLSIELIFMRLNEAAGRDEYMVNVT
jgi:hypothetical protein